MAPISRRAFNAALGAATAGALTGIAPRPALAERPAYDGPNVIIVRFGGGVRRLETIDRDRSFAPFLVHELAARGTLVPDMRIAQLDGVQTSHAEGTLNLLTGRYLAYRDAGSRLLEDRLEPVEPTLFEYFRKAYRIEPHEALLVNGEDRPQEEFFTYGIHGHYGIEFRSEMLSLHRFKLHKTARQIAEATDEVALAEAQAERAELLAKDRRGFAPTQSPALQRFWDGWRAQYGDSGLKNPRGDRLLTALALRAMTQLRPRLLMINYQDTDYVHWGNRSHYTRAIAVIDDGIRQLVAATDADPFYRDRTMLVIVPDCGRDANDLLNVPFQHHFNSRSAHEIWAFVMGPGIDRGKISDRPADQTAVAATIASVMGFQAGRAEGAPLEIAA